MLGILVEKWSNKYKTSVEQMKAKRDEPKPLPQAPTEAEISLELKHLFVDGIWCEDFFLFVTKTRPDQTKRISFVDQDKSNVTFYLEI